MDTTTRGTYVCKYLRNGQIELEHIVADWYGDAMTAFNEMHPEFREQVISWVNPEGLTLHFHDTLA